MIDQKAMPWRAYLLYCKIDSLNSDIRRLNFLAKNCTGKKLIIDRPSFKMRWFDFITPLPRIRFINPGRFCYSLQIAYKTTSLMLLWIDLEHVLATDRMRKRFNRKFESVDPIIVEPNISKPGSSGGQVITITCDVCFDGFADHLVSALNKAGKGSP